MELICSSDFPLMTRASLGTFSKSGTPLFMLSLCFNMTPNKAAPVNAPVARWFHVDHSRRRVTEQWRSTNRVALGCRIQSLCVPPWPLWLVRPALITTEDTESTEMRGSTPWACFPRHWSNKAAPPNPAGAPRVQATPGSRVGWQSDTIGPACLSRSLASHAPFSLP